MRVFTKMSLKSKLNWFPSLHCITQAWLLVDKMACRHGQWLLIYGMSSHGRPTKRRPVAWGLDLQLLNVKPRQVTKCYTMPQSGAGSPEHGDKSSESHRKVGVG